MINFEKFTNYAQEILYASGVKMNEYKKIGNKHQSLIDNFEFFNAYPKLLYSDLNHISLFIPLINVLRDINGFIR